MKIRFWNMKYTTFIVLFILILFFNNITIAKDKEKIVIIGSYRKFYEQINRKIELFEKNNFIVLMPPKSKIINPNDEFVKFQHEENKTIKEIEESFLNAIKIADFVYIFNPNGYIGSSSAFEIGFSYGLKKKIYCMEKPQDLILENTCEVR